MKSIHFLFACLLMGSIGFVEAQNPIVNKKTFQYSDQGTEYLFSKENWDIGNSLDTLSYSSQEFQYFEEIGQTLPSKDIFTYYFEDSSVTQRVLHFPTLRANLGLALLRGREVKIPALQTRASIDSIWSYDASGVAQLDYRRISINSPNQEGYILEDYKQGQIWQETQRYMRETRNSLDRNGCLLVRKQLLNGEIRERIEYLLDSDCKVEEEYICRKDYRGNVLSLDTLQHYIDGNFYIRENRNGNFKEVKEISTGRIVEIVEAASFSDRIDRTLFNVYTQLDSNISTIHTFRRYEHDTTWRRHEWIKSIEIPQKYKHTFEGHSWNARFQKWEEVRFSEKIYDREGDIVFSINYISFLNRNLGYLIPDLGIEYNYRYERSFDCEGLLQEKKLSTTTVATFLSNARNASNIPTSILLIVRKKTKVFPFTPIQSNIMKVSPSPGIQ